MVVQDLATQWLQSYPCITKTSQETQKSPMKFLEPTRKPKVIYTHNSLEFGKSCEELSWNHCTSTPHRSATNGIAERAVRIVKEGTSAVLLQSGLDKNGGRIPRSVIAICETFKTSCLMGRHIMKGSSECPLRDSYTVWSIGQISPYLCEGHIETTSVGPKVLPGNIPQLCIVCGRNLERRHCMIADIEELEEMDASGIHARRLSAKEVLTPIEGAILYSPVADGTVKSKPLEEIDVWNHPR